MTRYPTFGFLFMYALTAVAAGFARVWDFIVRATPDIPQIHNLLPTLEMVAPMPAGMAGSFKADRHEASVHRRSAARKI